MAGDETASATTTPETGGKKHFSVDEANRALPYVQRVLADIQATYREAVALRRRLDEDDAGDPEEGEGDPKEAYERALVRLDRLLGEIRAVGCELKDFEQGLIDFPCHVGDREVLLCWRQGEEAVEHWHELDAGFAGRRPIAELPSEA